MVTLSAFSALSQSDDSSGITSLAEVRRRLPEPSVVSIQESSNRLGSFQLYVAVSDMPHELAATPLLREVSLDDVSDRLCIKAS